MQLYFDLFKLLGKGAVYSRTTSWVFRLLPATALVVMVLVLCLLPQARVSALVFFPGDWVLALYLMGLARFALIAAALDTGSAFEGMGGSREAWVSILVEPALVLVLLAFVRSTGYLSLSEIYLNLGSVATGGPDAALILSVMVIFLVALAENSRIPFDDPETHLELTMIHEVQILDHSGPDLAAILYAASLKLWFFGALMLGLLLPITGGWMATMAFVGGMFVYAVLIGMVESTMARVRLPRMTELLLGAGAFAALALVMAMRG